MPLESDTHKVTNLFVFLFLFFLIFIFDQKYYILDMEGTLSKWTNVMHGWQHRYFVLNDDVLCYYTLKYFF